MSPCRFKLIFFVPSPALSACKAACFAAGAGRIGNYAQCCFTTPGVGQFEPLSGASPAIGSAPSASGDGGKVEEVDEVKCEMVCQDEDGVRSAIKALKGAHPYEEPAYEVYKLENF